MFVIIQLQMEVSKKMNIETNVWKLINKQLRSKSITIYRLSKLTGISETTLRNYKDGHEPSFKNMVKIADALNVSLDVFR